MACLVIIFSVSIALLFASFIKALSYLAQMSPLPIFLRKP